MTAAVLRLPQGGAGGPAPLVPAGINVSTADYMSPDIKLVQKRSARLTAELFGVWTRLHIASHLEEISGTLPNDDIDLAIAAGFGSEGVERWLSMKAKVLEDWLLCTDGRWHHPSRARNVLHIWIAGLERDRKSAVGNKGKSAKARATLAKLEDAIEYGRDVLARIAPEDRFLQGLDERIGKWPSKADDSDSVGPVVEATAPAGSPASYYGGDGDRGPRNTAPTVAVNVTKRSEVKDSSSPLRGDDSSDDQAEGDLEREPDGGSAKRTAPGAAKRERAPPWPPGWFAAFQARYPKREAWGRAEKALERIRRAGKIPFEEIMAGVERLVARIAAGQLQPQFACQPGKWLDGRGWEDDPAPAGSLMPPRGHPSRLRPVDPLAEAFRLVDERMNPS